MAADLQRLIELCRLRDRDFQFRVNAQWGSGLEDGRGRLRADIRSTLLPNEDISHLNARPRMNSHSVSISHTQGLGGWVSVRRPLRVGFDIERAERLTPEVIRRISTPDEINRSPDYRLIWTAKESAFKALDDGQPAVISKIELGSWSAVGDNLFYFNLASSSSADGIALILNEYIYSICFLKNVPY